MVLATGMRYVCVCLLTAAASLPPPHKTHLHATTQSLSTCNTQLLLLMLPLPLQLCCPSATSTTHTISSSSININIKLIPGCQQVVRILLSLCLKGCAVLQAGLGLFGSMLWQWCVCWWEGVTADERQTHALSMLAR